MPIDPGQLDPGHVDGGQSAIPPTCVSCGYDMRGATSNQCPECGYVVVRREALQHDANIKRAIDEHEEAVAWGRRGMILGAVGLGAAVCGLGLSVGRNYAGFDKGKHRWRAEPYRLGHGRTARRRVPLDHRLRSVVDAGGKRRRVLELNRVSTIRLFPRPGKPILSMVVVQSDETHQHDTQIGFQARL